MKTKKPVKLTLTQSSVQGLLAGEVVLIRPTKTRPGFVITIK